jgi:hypothetical protein
MAFGTVLVVDRFAARRGGRRTCGLRARRAARHQGSACGDSCKDPQRTSCVGHEASPRVVERRPFYLNSLSCSRGGSESVVTPEGIDAVRPSAKREGAPLIPRASHDETNVEVW